MSLINFLLNILSIFVLPLQNNNRSIIKWNNIQDTIIDPVYPILEPKFVNQKYSWNEYLVKNINHQIPIKNHAPKGTYRVTIDFLINNEGKVWQIRVLDAPKPDYGMIAEVLRVLKNCPLLVYLGGEFAEEKHKQSLVFVVD